jgi:SAM-dependent methyltransferase
VEVSIDFDYSVHYRRYHEPTREHALKLTAHFLPLLQKSGALKLPRDTTVLDVGCGMGFGLFAYETAGFSAARGIDVSDTQVECARAMGFNVEHVQDSIRFLEQHESAFGLISGFDLIEHLPVAEQIPMLRAMRAALAPGGTLILTVPNANSSWASRYRYIDWTHTSAFTEDSLDFVLRTAGFEEIRILDADPPMLRPIYHRSNLVWALRKFFRLIRRMEAIAEFGRRQGWSMPLSLNMLATARRLR